MGTYIRKQPLVGAGGRLVARKTVPATAPVKRVSPDPVLFDGNDYMLVVGNAADSCRGRRHVLERATGILVSLDGKPVHVGVDFCQGGRATWIGCEKSTSPTQRDAI